MMRGGRMQTHNTYWWMVWLVVGSIVLGIANLILNLIIVRGH